jgi:hypothetical protein
VHAWRIVHVAGRTVKCGAFCMLAALGTVKYAAFCTGSFVTCSCIASAVQPIRPCAMPASDEHWLQTEQTHVIQLSIEPSQAEQSMAGAATGPACRVSMDTAHWLATSHAAPGVRAWASCVERRGRVQPRCTLAHSCLEPTSSARRGCVCWSVSTCVGLDALRLA